MTQADLAARSGLSLKHVNQIAQGIAPITHETALLLEKVTGVDGENLGRRGCVGACRRSPGLIISVTWPPYRTSG